jgi:hypothetical protein
VVLGVLGLIPFVVTGVGAVGLDPVQIAQALGSKLVPSVAVGLTMAPLDPAHSLVMLSALMAYGAVILGFLGAVHWGLALAVTEAGGTSGRLFLGVLPALLGWGALLMNLSLPPEAGLGVLTAGFIAVMLAESRAGRRALLPAGYIWLRWVLSVVVVAVLSTVLVLRLLDAHAHATG